MSSRFSRLVVPVMGLLILAVSAWADDDAGPVVLIGAAKIDITPELPIRLSGYQARQTEANRAETKLFARALAIGRDAQKPAVLITLELIGVGEKTSDAVAAALKEKHGIDRARLAICAIHTHNGPALADVLPFMFSRDLPADEAERIERYTIGLRQKLVQVAEAALADRKPARMAFAEGRAEFAAQRRVVVDGTWKKFGVTPEGPVDHALPVLRVNDENGRLRAVFLNYACHCTTLGGSENFVHHEWAGDAARRLEEAHPGAIALVALGCGADANPNPRGIPAVPEHGAKIATEVERIVAGPMQAIGPLSAAEYRRIELDLDRVVPREELQERANNKQRVTPSYAATKFLEALDAGKPLPTQVPLPLQTWTFGTGLLMVFLGGETVSEYSLRLRRELDARRLWVNSYANHVPCYVASKRMFAEGGYEVDGSMDYYGWPSRLAVGTEDRIIAQVREMAPSAFQRAPRK